MAALSLMVIALAVVLVSIAAPSSPKEQELKMAMIEAQKDRDELLAVLEGRRALITADGQQYARVEWVTSKGIVK